MSSVYMRSISHCMHIRLMGNYCLIAVILKYAGTTGQTTGHPGAK